MNKNKIKQHMIDNAILDLGDEKEFYNRRKVFKKVYDAMESEMIMKDSLEYYRLNNTNVNTMRFSVMGEMNDYRYVDMNIQTLRFDSGISKRMMELNNKDGIDLTLINLGKRIAHEFNSVALMSIVDNSDRENDIIIDDNISMQNNLDKCITKTKLAGYSPNEIIMYPNITSEYLWDPDILKIIKLKYVNNQFCHYALDGKYPILIVCDYEKAGMIGMKGLTIRNFGEKILENLDTMQADLGFGISIIDPKAISVLLTN